MKLFDSIKIFKPRLNKFNLTHERKMSMEMGNLYPIMVQEIVPGDKFRVNSEVMIRMAPMIAPIMHRVNVKTEYFFVPNRLIWSEWEDFITGGRLGTSAPVAPFFNTNDGSFADKMAEGTLSDYLGLPSVAPAPAISINISALPFRAYQLIWDEYYRDQNLTASIDVSVASGQVVAGAELDKIMTLRPRAWEKDYFTSALPFAQRGSAAQVPLSDDETVQTKVSRVSTGLPFSEAGDMTIGNTGNALMTGSATQDGGAHIGAEGHGIDVNDLRRSIRLQEWLEKSARAGARYIEQIMAHFGVRSSDARLQRPEYLGGGVNPMRISEVLQTVGTDEPSPLGDMGGHGVSVGQQNGFQRSFEEHGFVIGLLSVLPRTAYQQGIERMWTRDDKFDYYWPEFANIGEQSILNKEIFYDAAAVLPDTHWGYQSRYAEYKYACSTVHGEFRSNLAFWHMGRIFTTQPSLNAAFITADPTDRIFAVETDTAQHLWCHVLNKVSALRPMPYFGTPTI